jgi:hypothetical protein
MQRVGQDSEAALRGAVDVLITEVFGDTERNLAKVRAAYLQTATVLSTDPRNKNFCYILVQEQALPIVPACSLFVRSIFFCAVWRQPRQQWHHSHGGVSAWQQTVGGGSW